MIRWDSQDSQPNWLLTWLRALLSGARQLKPETRLWN